MSPIFHSTVLRHLLNTVGDSNVLISFSWPVSAEKLKETDDLKLNVENLSEVDRNKKQMLELLSFLPVSLSFFLHSLSLAALQITFYFHLKVAY